MQSGELIVIGSSEVQIAIHGTPVKAEIYFADDDDADIIYTPCSPPHVNTLNWGMDVQAQTLTIRWSVSNIKEIRWKLFYYWNEVPA